MICQEHLFRSVRHAHTAVMAYSQCICDNATQEECELFHDYIAELATQLKTLREMCIKYYTVDPLQPRSKIVSEN